MWNRISKCYATCSITLNNKIITQRTANYLKPSSSTQSQLKVENNVERNKTLCQAAAPHRPSHRPQSKVQRLPACLWPPGASKVYYIFLLYIKCFVLVQTTVATAIIYFYKVRSEPQKTIQKTKTIQSLTPLFCYMARSQHSSWLTNWLFDCWVQFIEILIRDN